MSLLGQHGDKWPAVAEAAVSLRAASDGPVAQQWGEEMKQPRMNLELLMASDGVIFPQRPQIHPALCLQKSVVSVKCCVQQSSSFHRVHGEDSSACSSESGIGVFGKAVHVIHPRSWKGRSIKSILCVGKKMSARQGFLFSLSRRQDVDQEGALFAAKWKIGFSLLLDRMAGHLRLFSVGPG